MIRSLEDFVLHTLAAEGEQSVMSLRILFADYWGYHNIELSDRTLYWTCQTLIYVGRIEQIPFGDSYGYRLVPHA